MATKLPLRFKILYILNKAGDKPMTTKELYEQLAEDYKGESQCTLQKMEEHLMAIKAVALIEASDAYIDEDGEARYKYAITDYGRIRTKYLPPQWRN